MSSLFYFMIIGMTLDIQNKITKWVEEKLPEEEWQDCFLIAVEVNGKKIGVYIDSDSGISFGRCKRMSRHLEAYLDESGFMDGRYLLEVSSPGVDRPIFLKRQFLKNVGRSFKFYLKDDRVVEAELTSMDEDQLMTTRPHPEKKKESLEEVLDFNDIQKAVVQISFKKKKK